ncbi:hypothetical protein EJB05_22701 [Eragrostis curvula]|uniref:Uncharacterized protein n=1 Tax=Eragrostis curvula TaxID=38414 RepID=A0A5J9V546_9POAL|nr:hypothetical protein EJB05_22701 [Eragrostis curvula]
MSTLPSPPAEEPGGFDAGTEGHGGGAPRRRAAAGDAEGHPAGGRPGLQQEEDEDAVYDDEVAAAESGSNARRGGLRAEMADGRPPRPNTCCICWEPWVSSGAHRICALSVADNMNTTTFSISTRQQNVSGMITSQEQAPRHAPMEEEETRQVVKAAMEEIARKDEVIAKMEGKIARMTRVQEIRITLTKILETEKRIGLLKEINRMLYVLIVVLLLVLVALFMKL